MTPAERSRNTRLIKTYGITLDDYNKMLEAQDGKCAICRKPPREGRNLCIEHNHSTRAIRGLACAYCNRYLIGKFKDADTVQRIADYLRWPPANRFGFEPVPLRHPRRRLTKRRK